MADKVLMHVMFGMRGVQIMQGDPESHAFKCPHTTVELIDENEQVEHAWLFEHTHPMNELEAWHKFGVECKREAEAAMKQIRSHFNEMAHVDVVKTEVLVGIDEIENHSQLDDDPI